jgi:parallel beta-helix repeat protein
MKNNIYQNTSRGGIGFEGDHLDAIPTFTIRQNKVYEQTNTNYGGGIQVVSTPGSVTVENNLVYENKRGGIMVGDSAVSVMGNTVIYNGNTTDDVGGGIIFDNGQGLMGEPPSGAPIESFPVKNNISAYNVRAGLRACFYDTEDVGGNLFRNYNLLYSNNQDFLAGLCGDCASPDCSAGDRRDKKRCVGAQLGRGCEGDEMFCCTATGATGPLSGETLIFADPLFENVAGHDYHLQAGSPAIGSGENGLDMGCYGGTYPMHNLIDVDTNTGNTPSGGTIILFDLGDEYTVTDVRLYGTNAYPARDWEVLVGTDPTDCDLGTWGTSGETWSVGGGVQPGWYSHNLTPSSVTGTYLKLISTGAVNEQEVFEVQFKETTNTYWRTPLKVYNGACSDISG